MPSRTSHGLCWLVMPWTNGAQPRAWSCSADIGSCRSRLALDRHSQARSRASAHKTMRPSEVQRQRRRQRPPSERARSLRQGRRWEHWATPPRVGRGHTASRKRPLAATTPTPLPTTRWTPLIGACVLSATTICASLERHSMLWDPFECHVSGIMCYDTCRSCSGVCCVVHFMHAGRRCVRVDN